MRTKSISALLLATITMAPAAVIGASSYNDTVKTNFSHPISNVPGKSLVAVEVSYPPGGASAPHHHSDSAFIHLISRNASKTEPAKLLAVFVVETEDNALTTPDHVGGSK